MKKLWRYLGFIVLILLGIAYVAFLVVVLVQEVRAENRCLKAGYAEYTEYFGIKYCFGFRDGEPVIVPLEDLEVTN